MPPVTIETPAAEGQPEGGITQEALDAALAEAAAAEEARAQGKTPEALAAEKAAEAAAKEGEKPTKPEGVPDKFWDAEKGQVNTEALLKSYSELEAKQGQQPEKKTEGEQPKEGEEAQVSNALKDAGFEYQALADEFVANGDFKPETVDKLEKAFGKELVADYREAKKAQFASAATSFDTQVFSAVGGQETFSKATAWAASALTPAEIAEFNGHVTSGDLNRATLAAKGLAARMAAEGGNAPSLVNGGKTNSEAKGGYASVEQMGAALNDDRYRNDPAYRREVDAKVDASTHLLR